MVCFVDLRIAVVYFPSPPQRHLHVRLTRTEPHLAHKYIFQADAVFTGEGEGIGSSIGGCWYEQRPFTYLIGLGMVPL